MSQNPNQPTDPTQAAQSAAALRSLPTLEQTRTLLITTIEDAGQQISALVAGVSWSWDQDENRTGGCPAPYQQSDGHEILLASYVSKVPIPEQNWSQALKIVTDAAHRIGVTQVTVFQDKPGFHDVQFSGEAGTTLRFGSQKAALLSGGTGCRLPADKH